MVQHFPFPCDNNQSWKPKETFQYKFQNIHAEKFATFRYTSKLKYTLDNNHIYLRISSVRTCFEFLAITSRVSITFLDNVAFSYSVQHGRVTDRISIRWTVVLGIWSSSQSFLCATVLVCLVCEFFLIYLFMNTYAHAIIHDNDRLLTFRQQSLALFGFNPVSLELIAISGRVGLCHDSGDPFLLCNPFSLKIQFEYLIKRQWHILLGSPRQVNL